MIERNDVIEVASMPRCLGQTVPKVKAIMSRDRFPAVGHNVLMDDDQTNVAWDAAFRGRLKDARGVRTHEDMADLLCITRDAWNKYENRSAAAVPIRLLPKIAKIAGKPLEWLIEGDKATPAQQAKPRRRRRTG